MQHGFGLSLIHIVHSKKIAKMQKAGQRERDFHTLNGIRNKFLFNTSSCWLDCVVAKYSFCTYTSGRQQWRGVEQGGGGDSGVMLANSSKKILRRALLKFIYSEKATKFCEISTVDLTVTT